MPKQTLVLNFASSAPTIVSLVAFPGPYRCFHYCYCRERKFTLPKLTKSPLSPEEGWFGSFAGFPFSNCSSRGASRKFCIQLTSASGLNNRGLLIWFFLKGSSSQRRLSGCWWDGLASACNWWRSFWWHSEDSWNHSCIVLFLSPPVVW